jgi:hypothetical protein
MSKFEQLCEEVLKSLYEGKMKEGMPKAGDSAFVDGDEARTETGPHKGHSDVKDPVNEKDDEEMDHDGDEMHESDDEMDHDDDEMHESDDDMDDDDNDDDDDEEEEMDEDFPNVGDHAHVDGSDLHKKSY